MVVAGLVALVTEIQRIQGPLEPVEDGQVLTEEQAVQRYMKLGAMTRSGREVVKCLKAAAAILQEPKE